MSERPGGSSGRHPTRLGRMLGSSGRALLCLGPAFYTLGCASVQPVPVATLRAAPLPARIWVTKTDHRTIVLDRPELRGDTLVGLVSDKPERLLLSETLAIGAEEPSGVRTAALFVLVAGALVAVDAVMMNGSTSPAPPAP